MSQTLQRSLLIFVAGLALGSVLGFYMGWVAFPVRLVDVVPSDLEQPYQEDYLRLIAATYTTDGNLALAQTRISGLRKEDWRSWVLAETVDAILIETAGADTRRLVELAIAQGIESPAFAPYQIGEETGETDE